MLSNVLLKSPLSLSLTFGFIFFLSGSIFLSLPEISGSSEAREAHIASTILRSDEWVLPKRNGIVPSKPPLYHWIAASIGKAVLPEGTTLIPPGIARLPSLIFASLILIGTVFVASTVGTLLGKGNPLHSGILAGTILALCYPFASVAMLSMVDMVYVGCSLTAVFVGLFYPGKKVLFYTFLALAVLGKGPIGLVIPFLCLGTVLICQPVPRKPLLDLFRPSFGWMVFMIVTFSWYGAAYLQGGEAFIQRQLFFENIERFTGGEKTNTQRWWYYFPQFLKFAFPWSLLFFWLAFKEIKEFWKKRVSLLLPPPNASLIGQRMLLTVALIVIVGLVMLSIPAGKRHIYLLPFYPFMAIFLGVRLYEALQRTYEKTSTVFISAVTLLYGTTLALTSWAVLNDSSEHTFTGETLTFIVSNRQIMYWVGGLGLLASSVAMQKKFLKERLLCAVGLAIPLTFFIIQFQFAIKAHFKDSASIAQEINRRFSDRKLYALKNTFDESLDPLLYYLGREVTLIDPESNTSLPLVDGVLITSGKDETTAQKEGWKTYQRYNALGDKLRGRIDRSIVVFLPSEAEVAKVLRANNDL